MTHAKTCREVYDDMNAKLKEGMVRNYTSLIKMQDFTVATELFPIKALEVYSAYNLGEDIKEEDREKYFSAHRGGSQGDYREDMKDKIANVVDCLIKFPRSKRAVITIPNTSKPKHKNDDDAKCMREMHFYLDGNALNATVLMRAQAAEIFPKNIHFVGSLMDKVASAISEKKDLDGDDKISVGQLFYLATTLVSVRED